MKELGKLFPDPKYGRHPNRNFKGYLQPDFIPFWNDKKRNSKEFAEFRPPVGHYRTREMSDQQVLQWTEFAMKHGIRYKGSNLYDFSQATVRENHLGDEMEKLLFDEKKSIGLVKTHYRTPDARQARSAKRQKYRTLQPEVSISERRGCGSRKRDFRNFVKSSNTYYSFKDYMEKQPVNVCLQTYTGRSALSEPCIEALSKIYGNPIYFKKEKLLHIPTLKLVIPTPVIETGTPLDCRESRTAKYPDVTTWKTLDDKGLKYRIDAGQYYNVVGGLSLIGSDLPLGR
jgi:hypothetical protein